MSAPMQTMRPVKMGMGYGDFKEAGQLNNPPKGQSRKRRRAHETPARPR